MRVKKNALQITRNPPPSQLGFNRFASPPPCKTCNLQRQNLILQETPKRQKHTNLLKRYGMRLQNGNKSRPVFHARKFRGINPPTAAQNINPMPRNRRAAGAGAKPVSPLVPPRTRPPALPYHAREVLRRGRRAKYRRRGFARRQRASSAWRFGKHMRSTADSKSSQPSRISISSFV